MSKKIIITGSTGKVAEAITKFLLREYIDTELLLLTTKPKEIKPKTRAAVYSVDYTDVKWLKEFVNEHKPDIIINTAALTNVDACEDNKDLAMKLNATLPETLAIAAKKVDAHLITFSTDYIFDGENGPYHEDSVPNPINYYGKSKLAGENLVKGILEKLTIIRTNVVYGYSSYGKNDFIKWVHSKLKVEDKLDIITGQWCNPTFSDDIAWAVTKVMDLNIFGTYHVAGNDWLNRYEVALWVARIFGHNKKLINAVSPDTLEQKAERPKKGGLVITNTEATLGIKFSNLEEGLTSYKFQLTESQLW